MSTSPCRVTDPRKLEPAAIEWKWLHCSATGCESGRQDSNLRPLVPQTSPHFPMSAEFDLEWFCGELVGMTTRARVMESAGIASTSRDVRWPNPDRPRPLLSFCVSILVADVTTGAIRLLVAAGLVTRRSCGRPGCASSADRAGGHNDSRSYYWRMRASQVHREHLETRSALPPRLSSYVTSTAGMPGGGAGVRSAGFCVSAPGRFFALSIRTAHSASAGPHGADLFASSRAASEIKAPSLGRDCVPM
jgi:hypothetical protein